MCYGHDTDEVGGEGSETVYLQTKKMGTVKISHQ